MILLLHLDRRDMACSSRWKLKLDKSNLALGGNGEKVAVINHLDHFIREVVNALLPEP